MSDRLWRLCAILWVIVVAAIGAHNYLFWTAGSKRVDTDVLALLPRDANDRQVDEVTRRLADNASRELVVLVGASDWAAAARAGDAAAAQIASLPGTLRYRVDDSNMAAAVDWLNTYHTALLSDAQRTWLQHAGDAELTARAQSQLHQSFGPRIARWQDDPLGLAPEWLLSRGQGIKVQPRDGRLSASGEGKQWAVITVRLDGPGFRLDGEERIGAVLKAAQAAATAATPDAELIAAGVPLHAEAAAVQANFEMNTVGWGSLAGVMLLMWLGFRSLRPLSLVVVTLFVGCLAGVSACALVFERVHVITLVFGASLVGVAEDYGIHYFASRQDDPDTPPFALMRHLSPSLWLALLTSVLAYGALALAPFPGLRQMALFSAAGLVGAFVTAFLWYPWLDRGRPRQTKFSARWADSRRRWPSLRGRRGALIVLAIVALCATGWVQLTVRDDIRALQNPPPALRDAQVRAARILGLPSPAQFLFVHSRSPDAVLSVEETLRPALAAMVSDGHLTGWQALSDWVPSANRQADNMRVHNRARDEVWRSLADTLGLDAHPPALSEKALTLDAALAGPFGDALRPLWLGRIGDGFGSVILLSGVTPDSLAGLRAMAESHSEVRFVDKSADISRLLTHYRHSMSLLALLGIALIWLALARRFGRASWRAMAPTLLSAGLALAVLGWIGQPLQLFHVLAIFLVLGMGVDYGIFLLEHPQREDGAAWLAVGLGAASTLLSFGLLALSRTPALQAFGLVMAIGIATVWTTAPMFCTMKTESDRT
ncbi:MMPL family transporter [Uliginosibacterium sp. sgz301328]|uniref:MMPL family transporter n=1 Tax=Uliginosibacterium sp. sgz301328 TaxID=3243764 RepID=UPI00359CDA76